MTPKTRRFGLRRFKGEEDGSSTVEFVLWVPIFILILSLVVDVCFLFLAQSRMYDVASDATRRLAIGSMTEAQAETYAIQNASFRGESAVADAVPVEGGAAWQMTVELDSADVAVTGILPFIASNKLTAVVTQLKEND